MAGWFGRRARRTRLWVTITARRVDPAALLEECARSAELIAGESIAFDGASAALELRPASLRRTHAPRGDLALAGPDRARIATFVRELARVDTVEDIVVEAHVRGVEGVSSTSVLSLDALLERIEHGRLRAAVRYVTDRSDTH